MDLLCYFCGYSSEKKKKNAKTGKAKAINQDYLKPFLTYAI
jgi:hypothetical protein